MSISVLLKLHDCSAFSFWLYLPSQGIFGLWQTHAVVGWPSFSTFSTEAIIFYSPRLGIAFPSSGTLSLPFIASKTLILAQNTAARKKKNHFSL